MRFWQLKRKLKEIFTSRYRHLGRFRRQLRNGSTRAKKFVEKIDQCRPGRPCRKAPCILCWDRTANKAKAENHELFANIQKENISQVTVLFEPRFDLFEPRDTADEFKEFKKATRQKLPRSRSSIVRLNGRFEIELRQRDETEYLRQTDTLFHDQPESRSKEDESPEHNLKANERKVLIPHFHGLIAVFANDEWHSSRQIRSLFMAPDDHCDKVRVSKLRSDQDKDEAISKASGYMHKGFTAGFEGDLLEQYVRFYTDVRPDRLRFRIKRDSTNGACDDSTISEPARMAPVDCISVSGLVSERTLKFCKPPEERSESNRSAISDSQWDIGQTSCPRIEGPFND